MSMLLLLMKLMSNLLRLLLMMRKNPRKKLLKDIFDSILVSEALLLLSQSVSSRGQAPDKQAHALNISQNDVFLNPIDIAPEEVAPYCPQAGDTVRLRSDDPRFACYVVKIDRIEEENLICRWNFFPEETKEGRLQFHGETEVFSSDSSTIQSVHTVIGQCTVHALSDYNELIEAASDRDYFCRFHYNNETGSYVPDSTDVFCTCEMPQNPDEVMVQCNHYDKQLQQLQVYILHVSN